ncbi:putative FAD binding protein [Podospora didyma]|uniref:FAD binding protein n=1 Tax=Podospora didyma TaxID=330526 RepID=A0AAE0TZF9_9PEZI|nr:putative FAD binding protein [Podospora didyma]
MSSKSPSKTLVILGAGIAGVPIAHHVLRFTVPKVPNLRVILVSPNTDFYWSLASPRGIISEDFSEKLFLPLATAFSKYDPKNFELIHGTAETLDQDRNTVSVALASGGGGIRDIPYDAVVVATGSRDTQGMPWKGLGSTKDTRQALHDLQHKINTAKTIVVAGAGPTGVEVAGELGERFSSSSTNTEVIYVISDDLPLAPPAKHSVRETVRSALENKLKVTIIKNTRVSSATTSTEPGKTTLELTSKDGRKRTLVADVYLPAFGVTPNTGFVPPHLLAPSGQIKQTARGLRAEGCENVFVIGDAGNLEDTRSFNTDRQTHYLARVLQTYFIHGGEVEEPEYKPGTDFVLGLSIGKNMGAGQAMGMKIFGWVLWYFKSRYMGTDVVGDFVEGKRSITGKLKG